jgi:hypothetical protein
VVCWFMIAREVLVRQRLGYDRSDFSKEIGIYVVLGDKAAVGVWCVYAG